jgi:bifunctional non-homologous end joining protein LigD
MYPDEDVTKQDVIDYYRSVADVLLPHLTDRPLNLFRSPDGIRGSGFVQQHADHHVPDWVTTVEVPARGDDRPVPHLLCQDEATLVYVANLAGLELHRWLAPAGTPDRPDLLVVDLDPPDGVTPAELRHAATAVREMFDSVGLVPYVQTTGGRGYHVVVPLDGSADEQAVRPAVRALADDLAARQPDRFTTEQRKNRRGDRIFLDTNRNGYAQTAVAPYSLRARPGAPVATPLDWDELGSATPDKYRLRNVRRRLSRKTDPWQRIRADARPLAKAAAQSKR